ncbi:Rapid ALkalinization Factor [Gossypium australe]|uniref:Rapid ALkalinization Factor n=1 Tax=Gossypium australe TaxID=47621 RepID=A0A5B6USX8_9ROSI|nr:Rapid ALkalinization Factor [Gossypium australe]
MRLSIMKTLLICFALISMVVVQVDAAARSGVTYIHPGVLDPCKRPGGSHPRCHLCNIVNLYPSPE